MKTVKDVGPNLKSFFYHVCEPEDQSLIRGSVLVLHGAEGHGGRYEAFGNELAKHGYAMFAIDHIGHGLTVMDEKDDLGKWDKDDFDLSTYNAYYLVDRIKRMYPGKPVYLLGDDYGGAMAQYMMCKYEGAFEGIIISSCGMPSGRDKSVFLKAWLKKVCLYDGGKSNGTFKSRTRFLNSHYKPVRTKYDWMNSDPTEVDRFIEDPLSGYVGTIGYYYYQYKYIVTIPTSLKLKKANHNIPMLLIGGKDDYITGRGKQIEKLKHYYEGKGFSNVNINLYDGARHDVLLERSKDLVAEDIASFINRNTYKEEVVKKAASTQEVKVITIKETVDVPVNGNQTTVTSLKEEEPEDDLRLSTELKK